MALDEIGAANGIGMLLCANCGMATLHRNNICIGCRTQVIFPSQQTKVKLSKNARKVLLALDEKPRSRRRGVRA